MSRLAAMARPHAASATTVTAAAVSHANRRAVNEVPRGFEVVKVVSGHPRGGNRREVSEA
jgi:hypothetical protein